MSFKTHKLIDSSLDKNQNLFNAEVITFPGEKKIDLSKNLEINSISYWKISDRSNQDQLKAIVGICFMIGTLTLVGLYSNLF